MLLTTETKRYVYVEDRNGHTSLIGHEQPSTIYRQLMENYRLVAVKRSHRDYVVLKVS